MGNPRLATISTLRTTLTDAIGETQQLQTAGKKLLLIKPRAQAAPRSNLKPCVSGNETDKGIRKEMTVAARFFKNPK